MKAIFVDRDGVINKYPGDGDYVKSWEEFHFLPRVKPALKRLNQAGFQIFVISNQAGVSKGMYSREALDLLTENMLKALARSGVRISAVHYCTHQDKDRCACRKPETGLVDRVKAAAQKKGDAISLSESYFVGDTPRDIETGRKAGLKTILVFSGREKPENKKKWPLQPDSIAKDLYEAARIILK